MLTEVINCISLANRARYIFFYIFIFPLFNHLQLDYLIYFRLGEPYIVNIRELFLARQYILQYAAFIYRNDCNMRVAHIAVYCIFKYFAIYCQYIAIYCILQQYIVYCDNIQNVATIFSISRQ